MAVTRQILGKVVITNKGEYNSTTIYEILDVVSYQGSSYLSKVYDNDSLPTDDTKWQLLAQKGDTYEVSESDIENIANKITENANSNFNRNVSEKTETFNSNAKTKTDEFNSNANNTVSAYNVNAENKLKEYNENDTVKLKKYNDNATSSVDNYNSNASTKLNEYNTNSSDKLKKYNDNATKAFNNYNSNATTKLDEYNTNSDTKIKEYDEHSEELNTKINSTKNELERVKNNILETGAGTGTFIHLEDSAMAELQELEVDGVCEQKTTVGRNTLKPTIINTTVLNGVTYIPTYNSNGILEYIRITGTASPINSELPIGNFDVKNGTSYVISGNPDINTDIGLFYQLYEKDTKNWKTNIQSNNRIYMATEDASYDLVIHVGKGKTVDAIFYPQVVEGTQIYSYEPYTGGQPSPSPEYPQEIKTITDNLNITSCNDNIFNSFALENAEPRFIPRIESDGTIIIENVTAANGYCDTKTTLKQLCPSLKVGDTIYFYCITDFTENNVLKPSIYLSKSKYTIKNTYNTRVITQDDLDSNVIVYGGYNKTSHVKINISYRNVKSYQTHIQSQINANLPEGEFIGKLNDTYKDTLSVDLQDDGKYHLILNKMISKVILDGSDDENWMVSSLTVPGHKGFYTKIKNNMVQSIVGKCNYFQYKTYSEWEELVQAEFVENSYETIGIRVKETLAPTIEEFKNWLSTHNTEVYCALAKLYTLDLGVVDMPITYNEVTNLFTDSDLLPQINAKYYRNFVKTVQNLQINNDTLKTELTSIENRLTALENANATAESEVSE